MKAQDTNLREQVFSQIRGEIIAGHAPPGSMYSVPTIAESFGTSSTPVREALLELVRLGLLEPHRNRGFRVTAPSVEETKNIFDMREVLEIHAAVTVARMAKKNVAKLGRFADQIAAAVETKSFRAYLMADREFHHLLTAAAGKSHFLTDTVFSLRDRMRFYGDISEEGFERQKASVPEHYRIVELVNEGDAEALSSLLRRHIRSWEPLFMKAVKEKPRSAFAIGKP